MRLISGDNNLAYVNIKSTLLTTFEMLLLACLKFKLSCEKWLFKNHPLFSRSNNFGDILGVVDRFIIYLCKISSDSAYKKLFKSVDF